MMYANRWARMRVVAVGKTSFVTGFRLSGVAGIDVKTPEEALKEIMKMMQDKRVGLILVSDDVGRPIRSKLIDIRTKQAVPLIYEIPAPGSSLEKIEYRDLLKSMLKMA
ncbi:MAG: V-type ATP synthase subunit F [Candidatus Methylarchaceae archaeon HK02M1]|nr:V-type ATP synthase subunit F [Candidatus Methylarchaceae archaeon HK02M1]